MVFVATPSANSPASQVPQAPPCLSCLWLCWSGSSTAALVPAANRQQLLRCPSFAGCAPPSAAGCRLVLWWLTPTDLFCLQSLVPFAVAYSQLSCTAAACPSSASAASVAALPSADRVLARGRRRRPSVGPAAAAVADQVMSGEASPLPGSFGRLCQPAVKHEVLG
jgi:hypothetical protein